MTSNLLMAIIVLGASVFTFGFETAVVSTVQAMDRKSRPPPLSPLPWLSHHAQLDRVLIKLVSLDFEKQFGEFNPKTQKYFLSASRLAYLNSFPLIMYGVGIVIGAQMSERWGRRIVVITMNVVCIVGVLVSFFSTTYGQVLGGRLILYLHVGMEGYLVPMYIAEIVPAAIRGSSMFHVLHFGQQLTQYLQWLPPGLSVTSSLPSSRPSSPTSQAAWTAMRVGESLLD